MTLPNKLTMVRILLIPVMMILWFVPQLNTILSGIEIIPGASGDMIGSTGGFDGMNLLMLLELLIFAIASFTDFLDGNIARKRNLVTSFGKFADPLADKMLVFSAMVILMLDNPANMPGWVFIIMIIREFMVSGIRMVVATEGVVIAAAKMGKWKTATTMIAIIVLFFSHTCLAVQIIGQVLMYIACLLTVISGIEYFWNSKSVILKSI